MNINNGVWVALVLLAVALLVQGLSVREGFISDSANSERCGLNMAPCEFGFSCVNGYCMSSQPTPVPTTSGLPVFP